MKPENAEEVRARLLGDEQIRSMIAMRAYEIFQFRGGAAGHDADDWFQAEAEILNFVIEEEHRRGANEPAKLDQLSDRDEPIEHHPGQDTHEPLAAAHSMLEPVAQDLSSFPSIESEVPSPDTDRTVKKSTGPNLPRTKNAESRPLKASAKKSAPKVTAPKKAGKKSKKSRQDRPEIEK